MINFLKWLLRRDRIISRRIEVDRLLDEQIASFREKVESHERQLEETINHMEHIYKPDNFIGAKLDGNILIVEHRY